MSTTALTKRYKQRLAVDAVDIELPVGVVSGFVGPNGAGKTTTIQLLLGLCRPTSGTAQVLGRPISDPASYLGRVGALIEAPSFYPSLSGRRNLEVLTRLGRIDARRIPEVLELVELSDRANDFVRAYSLGMKQRLGVAAALLKNLELLILDEPANGLDPQGMVEMRELLRGLGDSGRTVLVSSHLLVELEHICDRVGIIRSGRLIAQGTLAELRGGSRSLLIQAQPQERALSLLTALLGPNSVHKSEDGQLLVTAPPTRTGEISRALVEAGLELTELRPVERSLEQTFLELTTSEGRAA